MIDFDSARKIAFDTLSKGNITSRVPDESKLSLAFLPEEFALQYDVFLVQTEYLNANGIGEDVSIYVVLKPDFPLTLPKIYLPKQEYERLKYIPHIDVAGNVCTFDTDTTRTNPSEPGGIVQECLSRAVKIIEAGVSKSNHADFEDEFKAYWNNIYDDETEVKQDILVLLDEPDTIAELSFVKLSKSISTYNHVIYDNNELSKRFINYLDYRKISYKKESICFIGKLSISLEPPLVLTNEIVALIVGSLSQQQQTKFRKYINGSDAPKFIFGYVFVGGKPLYLGWLHGKFNLKRNGYRKTTLDNYYVFKNLQKKDKLTRVSGQVFTPNQQVIRTDGITITNPEYKFVIAGLGSIGSNLLYFINGIKKPELRLIDYDILNVDNLNRHFLGFNYLGQFKTAALKNHYTLKNPFQVITFKNESIITTCQTDLTYINDADFIFCAIGKANIDQWIGEALKDDVIGKPIFFLWVEPYLVGGHCLYLTPGGKTYSDFFDSNNFYKNNIIDNNEYLTGNSHLSMREVGCQTSYMPYSTNDITSFLSAIFPKIRSIIETPPTTSLGITWIGDLMVLEDFKINTSIFTKDHIQESIIITE